MSNYTLSSTSAYINDFITYLENIPETKKANISICVKEYVDDRFSNISDKNLLIILFKTLSDNILEGGKLTKQGIETVSIIMRTLSKLKTLE